MQIPEFHWFFRPILETLSDGKTRHWKDLHRDITDPLPLTPDQRDEMLPSGSRTKLADRVQWALTYLRQACLVTSPKRGVSEITERGRKFLSQAPSSITLGDLRAIKEFRDFESRSRAKTSTGTSPTSITPAVSPEELTPEEEMERASRQLDDALAQEVLDHTKQMSPAHFERLIVNLMLSMGYGFSLDNAGEVLGKSGDEGVDGVISEDKLGLEKIYLQAKRWADKPVGAKEIQAFVGALAGKAATKGVFITTSTFTRDARSYVQRLSGSNISLVEGLQLAQLMIEYNLGVSSIKTYRVKRIDSDFFIDS